MSSPFYVRCECHTPYHCLVLERDADGSIDVQFVAESNGRFWHRVKWALRHVFKRDMLVEADLILSSKDAGRLAKYLTGADE